MNDYIFSYKITESEQRRVMDKVYTLMICDTYTGFEANYIEPNLNFEQNHTEISNEMETIYEGVIL